MKHKKVLLTLLIALFNSLHSYNKQETAFVSQFFKPGDLVFDIGACVGSKADCYLQAGAMVICVDPQPHCISVLLNKYNDNKRVAVVPYGIADKPGTLELAVCQDAIALTTFSKEWQEKSRYRERHDNSWDKIITVKVITLDHLIEAVGRKPAFCKIDVENFEYEVLSGLSQPIRYLSFEFHEETKHNTRKCLEHLQSLGYTQFNFVIMDSHQFVLPEWVGAEELLNQISITSSANRFGELLCGDIYAHHETC